MARRFVHIQERSFAEDRESAKLTGRNFDYFFEKVEDSVDSNPWLYGTEVPGGEGMLMLPTTEAFPDLPACYIYYTAVLEDELAEIRYFGMSPIWSQADVLPDDFS